MSARRRGVAVWAGLCLAGLAAAAALRADPYADGPGAPGVDPTPAESHPVDCEEVADRVARERREHDEAEARAVPSPSPSYRGEATFTVTLVPEECADELDARGLSSS
ncbi:hypothetical protein ABZ387_09965 [Streptomyces flaveolus]|uniref:hypothetical protein n=1 Tax=Streptomyces flaveolus TaxID=67297 RepID=UPI0033E19414